MSKPEARVVTWNIKANTGCDKKRLGQIQKRLDAQRADVVLLQEVQAGRTWARVSEALGELGLASASFSGTRHEERKHGVVVASRGGFRPIEKRSGFNWEGAVVGTPIGDILALSVHVPNGAKNGWKKVDALEGVAASLARVRRPIVVGGDFNEPKSFAADGRAEPFGLGRSKDGTWSSEYTDQDGETRPLSRWRDAVEKLLSPGSNLGLQHAFLSRYPKKRPETHRVKGEPRFFDHLLVRELRVLDAGYDHGVREDGVSDHSLGWARLGRAAD